MRCLFRCGFEFIYVTDYRARSCLVRQFLAKVGGQGRVAIALAPGRRRTSISRQPHVSRETVVAFGGPRKALGVRARRADAGGDAARAREAAAREDKRVLGDDLPSAIVNAMLIGTAVSLVLAYSAVCRFERTLRCYVNKSITDWDRHLHVLDTP